MADVIKTGLHKFRFLVVGALVLALLSTPLLTEAGAKKNSVAQLTAVADTIAGLSTEIELEGAAYKPIEVAVTKPNGSQLVLETVSDARGEATLTLSDYHLRTAGIYRVEARHADRNEGYGPSANFEVFPGTVSASESTISLSKNTADIGETIEMTVNLQDEYGNPIDGHVLKVKSNAESYSPAYATDKNGQMKFYVTSEQEGIIELTVYDSSVDKTLNAKPKVAFLGGSNEYLDRGGNSYSSSSYSNQSVWLATESGPIESFEITADNTAVTGDSINVTVTAIDADGITVEDYTGTIRFSSTDDSATLPNDYTFTADDLGEHTFSLSIKFVTQGAQTLTVTDTDQTSVDGEVDIEVTDEDSNFGDDFETDDFERDGDFSLISPASGSYSDDSVEVQGEADYGYIAVIYVNDEEAGRVEIEFDNSFSYTLEDLDDGTYIIYVDVAEIDEDAELEEAEIVAVIEESDSETIVIDTTAPEIVSISSDPEDTAAPGELVEITILSEKDLEEAYVLFEEEIYELTETSTSGKYTTEVVMPDEEGQYAVDVVLMDSLGNEVQHRDQLSLTASGEAVASDTNNDDEDTSDDEENVTGIGQVTGLTVTESEGAVLLNWEAPESENAIAYYRVYYGPYSDALYATSDTFDSSTSWSIPSLTGGETYYFSVAAIDTEGNEGPQADVSSGVALGKTSTDGDIPTTDTEPPITDSGTPEDTPESGPAGTALFLISTLGAAGYSAVRKKRAHA